MPSNKGKRKCKKKLLINNIEGISDSSPLLNRSRSASLESISSTKINDNSNNSKSSSLNINSQIAFDTPIIDMSFEDSPKHNRGKKRINNESLEFILKTPSAPLPPSKKKQNN